MHSRFWEFRHVGLDTTYDTRSSQYAVVLRSHETLCALWYPEIKLLDQVNYVDARNGSIPADFGHIQKLGYSREIFPPVG